MRVGTALALYVVTFPVLCTVPGTEYIVRNGELRNFTGRIDGTWWLVD